MSEVHIPGGFLLVLEGIDGAGKSTQIRRLQLLCDAFGLRSVASREPTYGPYGRQLRESAASARLAPAEEHRLLLLDRAQHVAELINPALARGEVVILDRYYYSSIAYQGAAGLDPELIRRDNEVIAPTPDLLLILDLDPAAGIARIHARGDRPNAFEASRTLTWCREVYRSFASLPYARLIDANADVDSVGAHAAAALVGALARKAPAWLANL